MNARKPEISMIVPAYNEGGRIIPTLRAFVSFLGDNRYNYELIVVDDGSTDGTYDVVRDISKEVPQLSIIRHPRNLGKGMAVKSGFLAASGAIVFFSDADHSTPIEELPKLIARIHEGYEIVIASRALPDSIIEKHQKWHRERMGKIFNWIVRIITVRGIHDTQCGFKSFQREKCAPVFARQRIGGFCFDVELLFIAKLRNLHIAEVPVLWRNSADTRVSTLKDSLRMFRDLLMIRYNQILGRYR